MRVVLDPNVFVSALLSPEGTSARVLLAWIDGAFELVVSPKLVAELERVLKYPKLVTRISKHETTELLDWLARAAISAGDPPESPVAVSDKDDDYLVALASAESAVLVSGDKALLELGDRFPVLAPVQFLTTLRD
ncbi:MAG: putative toxin-antitoxin system toxin component, PIN family [Solirubrobacteraceae bacterium]